MKKSGLLILVLFYAATAQSQVIISLIFGDKLNSEYLEFGLEGGLNLSTISDIGSGTNPGFNLGFYFDIKSKQNPAWMINTGVIVKSPMGAKDIPMYSLNDENLDKTFEGGNVDRELRYFNVPILLKYQFKNNIYVKGGTQLGLLNKAFDNFSKEVNEEDVTYKNNIRDHVNKIDAGLAIGAGYHLNVSEGMNIGIQYYYGLVQIMKGDEPHLYNRSLYITACIPIGKAKAKRKAETVGQPVQESK